MAAKKGLRLKGEVCRWVHLTQAANYDLYQAKEVAKGYLFFLSMAPRIIGAILVNSNPGP